MNKRERERLNLGEARVKSESAAGLLEETRERQKLERLGVLICKSLRFEA